MRVRTRWLAALVILAGALQALALADPWTDTAHGWLQILSLAVLCAVLRRPPDPGHPARPAWRRGFALGWLFATAWLAATFWWLYISMHVYGGLPGVLAALAVLALAAFLALDYALACALFTAAMGRGASGRPVLAPAFVFAALWTLAELARATWFTGFPWGAGGYAHVDGLLAGYAPLIGVYGMGFVAACIAALLPGLLAPSVGGAQRAAALAVIAALLAVGAAWPRLHPLPAPDPALHMKVELLQGNIPQDEKFVPGTGVATALRWYGEQLNASRAALVVAPETAIPLLPSQLPEGYLQALRARFSAPDQAALVGIPLGDAQVGYTNSVLGFAPGQDEPYRYDKHHLVPFGEFIPPLFRWFVDLMQIPLGDFNRGPLYQPPFDWQGQRIAPNICYEDLFSAQIAAGFADPARAPTVLVNVSNLGWFGTSLALDQHLAISRLRALEFQRPLLAAMNTGLTAIIDATGAVTDALPRGTRAVLHGSFQGQTRITPYAFWTARWGLWPLALFCVLIAALGVALPRRGAHP